MKALKADFNEVRTILKNNLKFAPQMRKHLLSLMGNPAGEDREFNTSSGPASSRQPTLSPRSSPNSTEVDSPERMSPCKAALAICDEKEDGERLPKGVDHWKAQAVDERHAMVATMPIRDLKTLVSGMDEIALNPYAVRVGPSVQARAK